MTCEPEGTRRYRVRTTTALATTVLVAGGYLVMFSPTAKAAEDVDVSVNEARKGDRLSAPGASTNEARKGDKALAAGAASNEARKEGKAVPAGATSNEARKEGKAIAAGASVNAAQKEGRPIQVPGLALAGASANEARKEGKLTQAPSGAAQADNGGPQYVDKYNTEVTSSQVKSDQVAAGGQEDIDDSFMPGPQYEKGYDAKKNVDVYGAKTQVKESRPLLEAGREQYTAGDYNQESSFLGQNNLLIPGLAVYGDWRTAIAYNQNNGKDIAQIATRVNIDVDFKITGTERIHAFFQPLQDNGRFTRCEFGGGGVDDRTCTLESDLNPQTLFLEGDVGSIWSGLSGTEAGFDLPFTAGLFPLFLQNGIWANDAILGGAVSLTAKNSQKLGLSNYDVTFFAAFDNVDNALVAGDTANRNNNVANLYGVTTFVDAFGGYVEAGYGLVQGVDDAADGQYTNFLTASFTKRYYNTISNSTRVFGNFGNGDEDEGLLLISENSLISGLPSTLLPYANFFVGTGNPQPLVDGNGAGLLKNVGINFETDALTGFPKLNDTGSNSYGGAIGLQYLFNLDQQLVFEVATVQPIGDPIAGVGVVDAQYAIGVRYQIPLNNDWLFRADATYQLVDNPDVEDNFGVRAELRRKF